MRFSTCHSFLSSSLLQLSIKCLISRSLTVPLLVYPWCCSLWLTLRADWRRWSWSMRWGQCVWLCAIPSYCGNITRRGSIVTWVLSGLTQTCTETHPNTYTLSFITVWTHREDWIWKKLKGWRKKELVIECDTSKKQKQKNILAVEKREYLKKEYCRVEIWNISLFFWIVLYIADAHKDKTNMQAQQNSDYITCSPAV